MAYTLITASALFADDSTLVNKTYSRSDSFISTDMDYSFSNVYHVGAADAPLTISFSSVVPAAKLLQVVSDYPVTVTINSTDHVLTAMNPPRKHVDSVDPACVLISTQVVTTLSIKPITGAVQSARVTIFLAGAAS